MGQPPKRNNWFQLIALSLFIVVFPAVSWYYLRTGLDYRLESIKELKEYGDVNNLNLVDTYGRVVKKEATQGNVIIATFSDNKGAITTQNQLVKLHEQFNERDDVLFFQHYTSLDEVTPPEDTTQCYLFESSSLQKIAQSAYGISSSKLTDIPMVAIVDTSGIVRNFYTINNNKSMGRLIEHIAMLMPFERKKALIYQPETEK